MNWISLKICFDRARNWIASLQFIFILIMFVEGHREYVLAIVPFLLLSVVWTWIDYKYIFPKESDIYCQVNPYFQKLEQDIKEIKEKLDEKSH